MKRAILILVILTLVLFGCTKQETTKPAPAITPQPAVPVPQPTPAPALDESDLTEIEEEDEYYADDLDKGIEDLMAIENAS